MKRKCGFLITLLFIPLLCFAKPNKTLIDSSTKLNAWCKSESYEYLHKSELKPFNWTVSHYRQLNELITEGRWRVKNDEISVRCSVIVGKNKHHAKMLILSDEEE